ncbi:hypothetical protein CR513_41326, partial [Mucuna pruriens]
MTKRTTIFDEFDAILESHSMFDGHCNHYGEPPSIKGIVDESKLNDLKVKDYLFQALDRNITETILNRDTTKDMRFNEREIFGFYEALRKEFKILEKKERETIDEYFKRTLSIRMKGNREEEQALKVSLCMENKRKKTKMW